MATRYATSATGENGTQYDLGYTDSLVIPKGVRTYCGGVGSFIAVKGVGANHVITVHGTIGFADDAYRAIEIQSDPTADIDTPTKNTVVVSTTGVVETSGLSIFLDGNADSVINKGIIRSTGFQALVFDGLYGRAIIKNSGTIVSDTTGIYSAIYSFQSVSIWNYGTISSLGTAIDASSTYGPSHYLKNSGKITGDIFLRGVTGSSILNSGTIDGAVTTGVSNDFVNNYSGTISKSVYLRFGNDTFAPGAGIDKAYGDDGSDTLTFAQTTGIGFALDGSITATGVAAGDTYGGFENLIGSKSGADTLAGDVNNNVLSGLGGDDTLIGQGGNDALYGGTGNDTLHGGTGDDVLAGDSGRDLLNGDDGNDTLSGGTGNDTLNGQEGDDTLNGNAGKDVLDGGNGVDRLYGDDGNDIVKGGDGDDYVYGGAGNDILIGGLGNDYLVGGAGADRFVYTAADLAGTSRETGFDAIDGLNRAEGDRIDLSALDANSLIEGNQSFKFVSGGVFHNVAGELIAGYISGGLYVQGDTNGDGLPDFAIEVRNALDPVAADFVL